MKQPKTIDIPFTESDLDDLKSGETFEWNFEGINVFLYNSDLEGCDECDEHVSKCTCRKCHLCDTKQENKYCVNESCAEYEADEATN